MRRVRTNDESGNNFDKHFREQLRNSEAEPSGDLWGKIDYKLDQEREKIKYDHWYYALLALLIPLTIANIYTNYDLEDYYASLSQQDQHNLHTDGLPVASLENTLFPFPKKDFPGACDIKDEANLNSPLNESAFIPDFSEILTDDNNAVPSANDDANHDLFESATASTHKELTNIEVQSLARRSPADDIASLIEDGQNLIGNPLSAVRGFHVGLDFGAHRNWFVFRKDALNPLISGDVEIQQPEYGTQFGVSFGYDFSHKFGLEVEGKFKSAQGVKFTETRYNGKLTINGELDLDYMHFPVLFKYKWTKIAPRTYNPRALNLLAGIQYSRLKSVNYTSDWTEYEVPEDLFNKNELGVTLGLEYDIFLHKNYYLSLGARGTFLSDAGSFPYFNSSRSSTYNYLVGVNASINYHIGKKDR